ncbi:MAG: hypothetical protein L6R42_001894 [Xanthoria sp. 1 TBL-2021]|nr:MAG: hypothetical protein L6R42_001894 [Xanthoria sp. 1 TBL-2021]
MDLFRKQREKLSRHLSAEDQDEGGDNDQEGRDVRGSWSPEARKKRASEPAISHRPPQEIDSSFSGSRNPSAAGSDFARIGSQHLRSSPLASPSASDPLGLTLVYALPSPILDIIFVHGLGGTSRGTWSWERDPSNFWPPWLVDDPELSRARMFTFGYNANFAGHSTSLNILDFAKDLLFRMKTHSGPYHQGDPSVGELPIIFVAHSMGGLVIKKAYIIGKANQQYENIIARISAMVFLATPHRGSAFAAMLNNILRATPGGSTKNYVAELEKQSGSLQDINEQFRNMCGSLELVSFHETLKTNVGAGIKKMIVDKDSALLEYPGEVSSSLIADHHGMAKFKNPQDTNYTNVKNVLKWLKRKSVSEDTRDLAFSFPQHKVIEGQASSELPLEQRLMNILGISESTDEDLDTLTERIMQGSCQWLLQRQSFQDWVSDAPSTSGVLWLTGNPGAGKSILASYVIALLKKRSFAGSCQFHFFLAGHQTKRSLSHMLCNIALQAAMCHENFCTRLIELHENTGIIFGQQKATIIWEKIFEGVLFRIPSQNPLFWVIDGLDEAESPTEMIKLLSRIKSAVRINVLLLSRANKDLLTGIRTLLPITVHEGISADDNKNDIRDYVVSSIQRILPGDQAQEEIVQDILSKASGSFLWVRLALERISDNWYTRDDIRAALTEIPAGMGPLYRRMIELIANQPPKPRKMAISILTWVACAFRPLETVELEVALKPEFQDFYSLEHTIEEVCGHFVVVNRSKITLIHHTAAQFLLQDTSNLPIAIVPSEGHQHITTVCIDFLSDSSKWRRVFSNMQTTQQSSSSPTRTPEFDDYPFLSYALKYWAYHFSLAPADSDELLETVLTFLEETCLLWVNGVALFENLRVLTRSAQHFKTLLKRRAISVSKRSTPSLTLTRDSELRRWANDIIRVVGRFGRNIMENPASIHKHIVPFCPRESIISRSFGSTSRSAFAVSGISSKRWDDCLARMTMGEDQTASKVLCKDTFFVTLVGLNGTVVVWSSETCEEIRRFTHGEYVTCMTSSRTSNLVATAGFKTTRVWDITTGEELYRLAKGRHHHTRTLAFGAGDDEILVGYDDCLIQCFDLATAQEKWNFLAKEPGSQDHNCARYVAISPDLTQVALVFRGRPVVVWNIQRSPSSFIPPKRCVLTEDSMRSAQEGDAWNAPEVALWQPGTDHLLIMYEDTKVVEWNIRDDEQSPYDHIGARGMVLSHDGSLLLTSDVNGTLSIWTVPTYRLTYRLKYEELVTDMAFSPDGTRFYDIRGTFCNVWEPDALIRSQDIDQDSASSHHDTISSEPVIASDDNTRVQITSLICNDSNSLYCCGKEDGTVMMYEIPKGNKIRQIAKHGSSTSVIKLAWSASGRYVASGDDSGRILVRRLDPPSSGKNEWAVFKLIDRRIDEAIEQLLFNTQDGLLLVAGRTTAFVMNVKTKTELCQARHSDQRDGLWINHPTSPGLLVKVDALNARRYLWKTLLPQDSSSIPNLQDLQLADSLGGVQRAVRVRERWLVLEILSPDPNYASSQRRHIELLDLHKLLSANESKRNTIEGLAMHVRCLIGCFQDQVVFLDHQFWLCTWAMEPVIASTNGISFSRKTG